MSRRTPRRPGRRLAITDEGRTRLLNAIRAGTPITYAADYAGITARTVFNYLARGEDADRRQREGEPLTEDEQTLLQLFHDVSRARADVAVRGVALVQRVAQGGAVVKETTRRYRDASGQLVTEVEKTFTPPDARPMQWLLERTHRAEFGKATTAVEVTGVDGGPVQVDGGDAIVSLAAKVAALTAERRLEIESASEDVVDAEVVDGDAE